VLSSLWNMFRVADLRNKIVFTLAIIALYRFGSFVPAPGIDIDAVDQLRRQAQDSGGILAYLQLFSGQGLTNFAVFALGIMPYITSSIIMQILTVVIPKLEEWQQQGAIGQRKITQWTRYLTISIAVLQSTASPCCSRRRWRSFSTTAAAACWAAAATPRGSTSCPTSRPPTCCWW
jgi:preprotein translocase subunit SecY